MLITTWLGWRGFADLQPRTVRDHYALELHQVGLSVGDLHATWRLALRHAKRSPLGLFSHWVRHGLVRSVLDDSRARAKAANRTRTWTPIPIVTQAVCEAFGFDPHARRIPSRLPRTVDREGLARAEAQLRELLPRLNFRDRRIAEQKLKELAREREDAGAIAMRREGAA